MTVANSLAVRAREQLGALPRCIGECVERGLRHALSRHASDLAVDAEAPRLISVLRVFPRLAPVGAAPRTSE